MSLVTVEKRSLSELEVDVGAVSSAAKKAKVEVALHPTHPYSILEHLVRDVLSERCRKDSVKDFYQCQLDDPDAAIEECKRRLQDWVLEYWESGKLNNLNKYVV